MPVLIRPIEFGDAPSYRACLDAVAREGRYLAQLEALPLDRVESFIRENVASDAVSSSRWQATASSAGPRSFRTGRLCWRTAARSASAR